MAYYLVKANLNQDQAAELRSRLDIGEIQKMRPFGRALQYSLDNMRVDQQGLQVWEEEDYCNPPLAQERAAVLDTYFANLTVKPVQKGEGWAEIDSLPNFWESFSTSV
jgi:hypothetical protein